jgi:uncharacterized protein YecE (DUF72 family)
MCGRTMCVRADRDADARPCALPVLVVQGSAAFAVNLVEASNPMNFYVGTSGYSYPKWQGTFYPKKLPAEHMLRFYGAHFRTVEINYTFRRLPTASVVQTWTDAVPAAFQFVLKAPEQITHRQRLKDSAAAVANFLDIAAQFKERLGPLLFQLPSNFKKDVPRLRTFLALLPRQRRVTFEFRHPSWFDDEVFELLRSCHSALGIADAEDDLEVPVVATTDWGYVRLRRPDYSAAALKTWVQRLQQQAWQDVFVFFKHEDKGKGPQFAQRFLELVA